MKKALFLLTPVLLLGLLSGCSMLPSFAPTAEPIPTLAVQATEIPLPTMEPTAMPTPTQTATPAPTATPSLVTAIKALTTMDNYILRTGPGRLFERVALYPSGSNVTILGRESGNNWVFVQTEDNLAGWMNIVGLSFDPTLIASEQTAITEKDLLTLPAYVIFDSQILRGHVYKADQTPASGIVVGLFPVGNDDFNLQDNNVTNMNGEWFIYVPDDTTGSWTVGPVGYGCSSSAVDNPVSCALQGKLPESREITLPLENNLAIEFSILSY